MAVLTEIINRRFWANGSFSSSGITLYIFRASTMIMGWLPFNRKWSTSCSNLLLKPLTTHSPRLRISVAQSYTCSTVSEEMVLDAKKAVFFSCNSSWLPRYSTFIVSQLSFCIVFNNFPVTTIATTDIFDMSEFCNMAFDGRKSLFTCSC